MRLSFVILTILVAPLTQGQQSREVANLCALVSGTATHHGDPVRVAGVVRGGGGALYDPACRDGELLISLEFTDKHPERLTEILRKKGRAHVVVEGAFYAFEPVAVDPKLPDRIKERLAGTFRRYGHLGAFAFMIEVTKFVSVREVEEDSKTKTR